MKDISHKRHIAKTFSWRIVGTLDTVLLAWLVTNDFYIGIKIGFIEVITKMVLYYFHERVWFKANLSRKGLILESRKRHVAKTLTWRLIGTLDTMIIAWIISGNYLSGLKIGFAEVVTKMILYYFHERTWYRMNFGLSKRSKSK